MIRRRAIRSLLFWMAVALALAVLAPGRPANTAQPATRWSATPSVPCPLSLQAGQSAKLVRASFGTDAPTLRSAMFPRDRQRAAECRACQQPPPAGLLEFDPLHRRPPPNFS